MTLAFLAVVLGLALLVWSADRFVEGSAATARHYGMPSLLIGSNLFNTLAVVGIAGAISPMTPGPEVLNRDMLVMAALTLSLFVFGYGFRKMGRINRMEGTALLIAYVAYVAYLIVTTFNGAA